MGQVSRESATHSQMIMAAAHAAAAICRPSRAPGVGIPVLGLTPQAMSLSRLRRSYRSIHSPSREAATDELLENQVDLIVGAFPHAEGEQPTTDCFVLWGEAFGEHFRDPLGGG